MEKRFYTKAELDEFREIILQKLTESRNEFKRLSEMIREFSSGSADNTNFAELGNDSRDKEEMEILKERQGKFIRGLENAMVRIQNGTYGICRLTGELIPKERLRLVPHATTTVVAKNQIKPIEPNEEV